jgi:hypothetical protein
MHRINNGHSGISVGKMVIVFSWTAQDIQYHGEM